MGGVISGIGAAIAGALAAAGTATITLLSEIGAIVAIQTVALASIDTIFVFGAGVGASFDALIGIGLTGAGASTTWAVTSVGVALVAGLAIAEYSAIAAFAYGATVGFRADQNETVLDKIVKPRNDLFTNQPDLICQLTGTRGNNGKMQCRNVSSRAVRFQTGGETDPAVLRAEKNSGVRRKRRSDVRSPSQTPKSRKIPVQRKRLRTKSRR
jgi:hypothetical protein